MTRRTFGKLLAASTISAAALPGRAEDYKVPDVVASYTMTTDERELAQKFFDGHEKDMMPLRSKRLPNDLFPALTFVAPVEQSKSTK